MRKKRVLALVVFVLLFILGACTAVVTVAPVPGDLEVELKLSNQKDVIIIPNYFNYVVTVKGDTTTKTLSGSFPATTFTIQFKDLPPDDYTVEAEIYYQTTFFSYAKVENVLVKSGEVTRVKLTVNPY